MRLLIAALFALCVASSASALQRLSAGPDQHVVIRTSIEDVTRITVVGDRIRRFVNDGSAYEMTNDEKTGDAFLRFAGEGRPARETGFIITESGMTITYTLEPKTGSKTAETAVITVKGSKQAASSKPAPVLQTSSGPGGVSAGGGHNARLAAFVKQVFDKHIAGRSVSRVKSGTVVNGSGMRARIVAARAGASGGQINESKYYKANVLAVFAVKRRLTANERTLVVIVEKR